MVIRMCSIRRRAALLTEMVVAMGILLIALIPLSLGFIDDVKASRAFYFRALATEIVDGEMEILRAGGWRSFRPGPQGFVTRAEAATNLPPGEFKLTLGEKALRLEWIPKSGGSGGTVVREIPFPIRSPDGGERMK